MAGATSFDTGSFLELSRKLKKKATGWTPEAPKFPELKRASCVPFRQRKPGESGSDVYNNP